MVKNGERKTKLLEEAIDASIKFERLMDKTDFDSWLDSEELGALEKLRQEVAPYNKFKENENILNRICKQIKQKGNNKINDSEEKFQIGKRLIYNLFEAKNKRLEARRCSKKEDEKEKYKEALPCLLSALNEHPKFCLQMKQNESNKSLNPEEDNALNKWLILLYNDLSICYAGLENSYMSRGYAKEAKNIIEEEKTYKEFEEIFEEFEKKLDSATLTRISNCDFVSSKLYDLYIVALFNQAQAERRSFSYADAEKNFRKIIKYAEGKTKDNKITPLRNFNYYSALLNLGDLYMDLSRGKEAVELLDKAINKLDENDIRYWNASIAKINALIDKTKYEDAKDDLLHKNIIIERENGFDLSKRHKITSTGFKGLNCFVRCIIENARNDLKRNDKKKETELKQAVKFIEENKDIMSVRNQKGSETKAYKQLSDIYKILSQDKEDKDISEYDKQVIDNLIKFISDTAIDNLDAFIDDPERGKWIDKCDDLDVLESFTDQIIKVTENKSIDKYIDLLEKLKKKIIKECEDKDQLARAERIVRKINKVKEEEEYDEFKMFLSNIKFLDNPSHDENIKDIDLTNKDICKRLDINEKDFDSVLFKRSEIKENHIAEVIVLRRWNSFSPGLYREYTGSLGGGYLLRINKEFMEGNDGVKKEENEQVENIVIDPGYNFLQNLRREGFYINDIDTIIVTHSHLDHCAELLPVMDLMYQFNKRYKGTPNEERQRKRVNLCLSQGAYKKFFSYIDDPDWKKQLKDVIILENLGEMKWEPFKGLKISAVPTPHMDLGGVNAIGLKIEIEEKKLCLGFTGDTPWDQKIKKRFKACDLLCVHLGSIKYQEIGYTDDRYNLKIKSKPRKISSETEQRKEVYKKYGEANHLLFYGTLDFIECCADKDEPLIIVGEFGEELKYGLRRDLCEKLCREVNEKRKEKKTPDIVCLPGDIGLYVGIDKDGTKKVRCNFCEEFVEQEEIKTFSYGREDAIHYICKTCNNTLSDIQKQAFIEHRVTKH